MNRLVLMVIIVILAFGFSFKNSEQHISLEYYFGLSSGPLPVYQVVLGTFLIGIFLGTGLILPECIRFYMKARRHRKTLSRLGQELEAIKPAAPESGNHED